MTKETNKENRLKTKRDSTGFTSVFRDPALGAKRCQNVVASCGSNVEVMWSRHAVAMWSKRGLQKLLPNMWSCDTVKNMPTNCGQKKIEEKQMNVFSNFRIIFAFHKSVRLHSGSPE